MFSTTACRFSCACCIPKELPVSDSDLCIVLGNALENAMEACAKLGTASARSVSAEVNTIGGQLLIKITNTYNGTVSRAGERYLSTKVQPYHGMGLQNIKKIVDGYGGYIKTQHDEATFVLMVALPSALDRRSR